MSGESITIAVRVRPFTPEENAEKQLLCIEMVSLKPQFLLLRVFVD
jgi:hypothetical protein